LVLVLQCTIEGGLSDLIRHNDTIRFA
jgi:hypothetical protein